MATPSLTETERAKLFDLLSSPPLREIEIGGKIYPIGAIRDDHVRMHMDRIARIREGTATEDDNSPFWQLVILLRQGDSNLDVKKVSGVEAGHVIAANCEYLRQLAVKMFASPSAASRPEAWAGREQ